MVDRNKQEKNSAYFAFAASWETNMTKIVHFLVVPRNEAKMAVR
jgi:hypothetical protein